MADVELMVNQITKKLDNYVNKRLELFNKKVFWHTGAAFDELIKNINAILFIDGTRFEEMDISVTSMLDRTFKKYGNDDITKFCISRNKLKAVHIDLMNKIQQAFEEHALNIIKQEEELATMSDEGLELLLQYMLKKTDPTHYGGFPEDKFYETWENNFRKLVVDVIAYRSYY